METNKRKNILLGISGSVASIKLKDLTDQLSKAFNVNICIIPTQNSMHFVPDFNSLNEYPNLEDRLDLITHDKQNSKNFVISFTDQDEWTSWQKRSDPVLHIELKKWADLLLIAPLDANTLAKLANGLCDNLLTCITRAWDLEEIKSRPIVICPAMNTFMFKHPITKKQLDILTNEFGFTIVECIEKLLMCGDIGMGAMANVETIVNTIRDLLD